MLLRIKLSATRCLILFFVLVSLSDCTVMKRKYLNGWHVEWFSAKKNPANKEPLSTNKSSAPHKAEPANSKSQSTAAPAPVHAPTASEAPQSNINTFPNLKATAPKKNVQPLTGFRKIISGKTPPPENSSVNNTLRLATVYFLFGLFLILAALFAISLMNAPRLSVGLFLAALSVLIISIALSADFLHDINAKKLPHKKWPYKLILGFGIVLVAAASALIFALALALFFVSPALELIAAGSVLFFLLLNVLLFSLLMRE